MKFLPMPFEGVYMIVPKVHQDNRGTFTKLFQRSAFEEFGLRCDFGEGYMTTSEQGVLRGMHVQAIPKHGEKIVYCSKGHVVDYLLDLRRDSKTYKQSIDFVLDQYYGSMIYMPAGIAHGFYALSEKVTMNYWQHAEYDALSDVGVHYAKCGLSFIPENPIVSQRDLLLPSLDEFESSFE